MATKLVSADTSKRSGAMQQGFEGGGERAILMPQLGDLWVTPRTVRVSLFKAGQGEGKRCAFSYPGCVAGVEGKANGGCRYAHIQAQAGERRERPWAAFDVDVSRFLRSERTSR